MDAHVVIADTELLCGLFWGDTTVVDDRKYVHLTATKRRDFLPIFI